MILLKMNFYNYLILALCLISCKDDRLVSRTHSNTKIDSLHSISDVQRFINSKDTSLINFELKKANVLRSQKLEKFSKTKENIPFCKGDFDNNGFTDLLVIGTFDNSQHFLHSYAFMNYGNDSIVSAQFKEGYKTFIAKTNKTNSQDFLEIYSTYFQVPRKDVLIYKYGGFINFNKNIGKYNIEKIEFESNDIRGTYEIVIGRSLNISIKNTQGYYDQNIVKKTDVKLTKKEHDEIFNLINYMDFPKLKDTLFTGASCEPFCNLKITYDNGKVKKIFDSGMEENFSLRNLYTKLEAPRKFLK